MNLSIEFSRKLLSAYSIACRPLCRELELSQTAFDILMFLGNNPRYKTASDIVEFRHIKANLVSVNVERLVREGYLVRRRVKDDRRKTNLVCTEKAEQVVTRGRRLQKRFSERLFANMDADLRKAFATAIDRIEENLNRALEEEAT